MSYIFKSSRISMPKTETNAFKGIKGDLVPLHDELCVEKTIMEEVGRSQWAPAIIRTEDNDSPLIHVKRNGEMLMNFRAVTGAMPHQIDDPRWVHDQAIQCEDALSTGDIDFDEIADAIEFIQFDEDHDSIGIFLNPAFAAREDIPPLFYYAPENEDDATRICETLRDAGYLFVKESEVGDDAEYMSVINPKQVQKLYYHENDEHSVEFLYHENVFFGLANSRAELITMFGEEEYYDKAYFHDWDTLEPIPLRDLSDDYLTAPSV